MGQTGSIFRLFIKEEFVGAESISARFALIGCDRAQPCQTCYKIHSMRNISS